MSLYIERELLRSDLPADCISDCSHQGQCADDVAFWVKQLDLAVHEENARAYLINCGMERERITEMDPTELAEYILWLACGLFKEGDDLFYLG